MAKRGMQEAPVHGRRVLVRVDFNVPQEPNGQVADDRRIVEALPTLNHLRAAGARTILMSHLGRPEGHKDPRFSLRPVARRLSALLGQPVPVAGDTVGIEALELSARLQNGQFLLLENLRFHPGEEANDPAFAAQLARLGEVFIEDAFGTVHRAHASTVGVPRRLPSFAGLLVEREVHELSRLVTSPSRPYAVVVGGAKVKDKLPLLTSFLGRADRLLIGGALANPFLAVSGAPLGASPVEPGLEGAVTDFGVPPVRPPRKCSSRRTSWSITPVTRRPRCIRSDRSPPTQSPWTSGPRHGPDSSPPSPGRTRSSGTGRSAVRKTPASRKGHDRS
jgi:3-phosphoglycerate kinase